MPLTGSNIWTKLPHLIDEVVEAARYYTRILLPTSNTSTSTSTSTGTSR